VPAEPGEVVAADWFPGEAGSVGQARDFVRGLLAGACPVLDDVLLMVSELASNAVRHTASGDRDGWFDLTVVLIGGGLMISVADSGGSSEPVIANCGGRPCGDAATGGRGLLIVDTLARKWGHSGDELGRVVWFSVEWEPGPEAARSPARSPGRSRCVLASPGQERDGNDPAAA
jgi:serine/threonine-protein kinase RsbW